MKLPAGEVEGRLKRLRSEMRAKKLGAALMTNAQDVRYLSGFTGSDSVLLVTQRSLYLVTDFRYLEEAEQSAPLAEIRVRKKELYESTAELVGKRRIKRLGYAPGQVSAQALQTLKRVARGVRFVALGDLMRTIRSVKSAWELRRMRAALTCAEEAFLATRSRIQPGMTELDVRFDLEYQMARRGAEHPAFETIVGAGANASRPHAHAGRRKVRAGGLLLIDWGACIDGYNSDLTRTLFLGSMPRSWKRRYELVLQAQTAAIKKLLPGASALSVDAEARGVFAAAGVLEKFGHGLGHGVGLAVHEGPGLSVTSTVTLAAGMVVTVEPALYFPRRGGIRIEDMVAVTKTGHTILSSLDKSLDWAVI